MRFYKREHAFYFGVDLHAKLPSPPWRDDAHLPGEPAASRGDGEYGRAYGTT